MRRALVALALMVAAGGCAPPPAANPPAPSTSPGAVSIAWPAVSADDSDTFGIDISGTGTGVTKVDIRSRYGNVSVGGRNVTALVYWQIPFSGYMLYQSLAVEAHAWTVFWFYCRGAALTYVYWERTTSSTLNKAPMTGSCTASPTTHATVSWPAVSMAAPVPVLGFSAHGPQIDIGSGVPGRAVLDGRTWTLYPYATVDCSTVCGSPGWYELHSLLWDSQTSEAAFGIVYFITGHSSEVQIEYSLELPTLGRFAQASFAADWTHTT